MGGFVYGKIRWNRRRILSLVKGLLAAYAVTAGLLMLLALVILQLNVSEGTVAAGVMVIYLLSCFLGGFLLGKGVGKNKFLWGNPGRCLFCTADDSVRRGGIRKLRGAGRIFSTFLLCCAGGMAGGMLA